MLNASGPILVSFTACAALLVSTAWSANCLQQHENRSLIGDA
jgi:hypothetical protein